MFDLKKAKVYDEMMMKLSEVHGELMVAQGKAYTVGLHDFNDRFIDLQYQIKHLMKELANTYSATELGGS